MNAAPAVADGHLAYKDAVFVSPHKFVGGPGTPGVLVVKRSLLRNRVPAVPGGGTVVFVSPYGHSYHPDPAIREEGGTPGIVESIRAGLAFELKEAVGSDEIRRRERDFARRALRSWGANPQIEILGDTERERLAIVSLGLRHGGSLLHANFVVAVLSDLFGIQARSGCFCAAPYLHRMYPIDDVWSARMEAEVARGHSGAKLAFTRLSFNFFISEAVVRIHRRRRPPARPRGVEAAAAVSLRSRQRPVAAPRRHAGAAGEPPRRARPDAREVRHGAGERAGRPARGCPADPRRHRRATADRPARRSDAERGVRADPLVRAAGRGPRGAHGCFSGVGLTWTDRGLLSPRALARVHDAS